MMRTYRWLALVLLALPGLLMGAELDAARAQLSVPFGIAEGQILKTGDSLVFANTSEPGQSFAVSRTEVESLTATNDVLTLVTHSPIRDRTTFTFKVSDSSTALEFSSWLEERSANPRADESRAVFSRTYVVRHKRKMGSDSEGRLVFEGDRVSYESITDIDRSRSWTLSEIKELKRKNPYRVEVSPFVGDSYSFDLVGVGLSAADYGHLADRITELRLR